MGEATRRAVAGGRAACPVEVEVDSPEQIDEALAAGAQMILLDNFTPDDGAGGGGAHRAAACPSRSRAA